jgi:hypothetical protein
VVISKSNLSTRKKSHGAPKFQCAPCETFLGKLIADFNVRKYALLFPAQVPALPIRSPDRRGDRSDVGMPRTGRAAALPMAKLIARKNFFGAIAQFYRLYMRDSDSGENQP